MRLWCAAIALSGTVIAVPPAQAYQEAPVENGGTIKGKITYGPGATAILPTKDQQVCGQMRKEPQVSVGADGGSRMPSSTWTRWGAAGVAGEAKQVALDKKGCVLQPHVQVMPSGASACTTPTRCSTTPTGSRQAHGVQRGAAKPGPDRSTRPQRRRAGAGRVRRPRVDARLDLRRREPVLRGDRQGRHVRDRRRSARRLHAGGLAGITGPVEVPVTVKGRRRSRCRSS